MPSSLGYAVGQQSILIIVRKTMLLFELLLLDLILPDGILIARPVEVDDGPGVSKGGVIAIKTPCRHRRELFMTVTTRRELVFRDNTVLGDCIANRSSHHTREKYG